MKTKLILSAILALASLACQAVQLLNNGSFEDDGGWILKLHDGARGHLERVRQPRTGQFAMKLVKENDLGFCQLVSQQPVALKAGKNVVFHGYFQTQHSKLDALLLFRFTETQDDQAFLYDAVDSSFGYSCQSLLINTNPGEWYKRLASNHPVKDCILYPNVIYYGGKGDVLLDDLTVKDKTYLRTVPSDMEERTTYPYTTEQVLKALAARKPVEAWVDANGGKARLLLNGKPVVPCMYKAEPYLDNFVHNRYTEFGEAGVPFVHRPVSLAWIQKPRVAGSQQNQYDFKRLEEVLCHALRQNPQANLVISLGTSEPYFKWGHSHQEELWRNAQGKFGWGLWGNCEGFVSSLEEMERLAAARGKRFKPYGYASYSSPVYQQDVCQALTDIVSYLMASPYGKAIAGFHIGGGHDGQFQYFGPDHSQPALKSFRAFLRRRHGSIRKLNRSYGTSYGAFGEIGIPDRPTETPMTYGLYADYRAFQREESFHLRHLFGNAIRKAAGKRVFVSAYGLPVLYHGETFCREEGGVDIYAVPAWYPFRQPGYPLGAKPEAIFQRHGKLWLHELDLRSWTDWSDNEVYDMWLGSALDFRQWASVHRKTAGVALAHDYPWWYYSMYRYFDRPEIMAEIKKTMQVVKRVIDAPDGNFRPDVCVIRSEIADDLCTYQSGSQVSSHIVPWQLQQFEISGVPYDVHYLSDVLKDSRLQNYKMYVFMHTLGLTREERKAIRQKLRGRDRTLVFMYNAGYVDPKQGKSTSTMKELTGLNITTEERYDRLTAYLCPEHPLAQGISSICAGGELIFSTFALRGDSPHSVATQIFRPTCDKKADILGRYADGTPAIICRQTKKGRIIYAAPSFSLNAELFHRLAQTAGAYVCAEPGQSIHMNGKFISLHGVTPGQHSLTVPDGVSQVTELFTDQKLELKDRKITLDVKVGDGIWLLMERY